MSRPAAPTATQMLFSTIFQAITVVILPQTEKNLHKSNITGECRSFVDSSCVSHLCANPLNCIKNPLGADLCASKRSHTLYHLMRASKLARICVCVRANVRNGMSNYTFARVHLTLRRRQLATRSPTPGATCSSRPRVSTQGGNTTPRTQSTNTHKHFPYVHTNGRNVM